MKKLKRIFIAVLAICLSFGSLFGATAIYKNTTFSSLAYSQTADKSILSDLKELEDFDEKNYTEDMPVKLIHIKENKQTLYIYTYMNSENLKYNLSSINISTNPDKLDFNNYKLEVVSKYNNFVKCKVKGLAIKTDTVQYNISSIYTDETSQNGSQTTNETAYEVGTRFVFSTNEKNEPVFTKYETETIEITDKFVGFVRYEDGFSLYPTSCDSHFVAFSTNKNIDKLLEADVYFTSQDYSRRKPNAGTEKITYGDKIEQKTYLNYSDIVNYEQSGILHKKYIWNRISTASDFIKNETTSNIYSCGVFNVSIGANLTEDAKSEIENKQFVLRFFESEYSKTTHTSSTSGLIGGYTVYKGTMIGNITILRLKFEKDGITYNLGVIDNKTTGSETPVNGNFKITVIPNFDWQKIVKIILIVLIIIATIPLIPVILNLLSYIIKALVAIIKFPFKLAKQKK